MQRACVLQVVRVVRAGPFRPAGAEQREQQAAEPAAAAGTGSEGVNEGAAVRQDEQDGQPQEAGSQRGPELAEQERQEGAELVQEPTQ